MRAVYLCLILLSSSLVRAQTGVPYQLPPAAMAQFFTGTSSTFSMNSTGEWMLIWGSDEYPSVEDLAYRYITIGGLVVNADNFTSINEKYMQGVRIRNTRTKKEYAVKGLPTPLKAAGILMDASRTKVAFTQTTANAVDLYVIDIASQTAKKANRQPLHTAVGPAFAWTGAHLLYKTIVQTADRAPLANSKPTGPFVMESGGGASASASQSYSVHLIRSAYEEALFEFYTTSQLIENVQGIEKKIGAPAMYLSAGLSPDKEHFLVTTIEKPFSYDVTYEGFPYVATVLDRKGKLMTNVLAVPARASLQQDAPRFIQWRGDQPASITWVNGGEVYELKAPFTAKPERLFGTKTKISKLLWSRDGLAWVQGGMWSDKIEKISLYNSHTKALELLHEQPINDAFNRLGLPVTAVNQTGQELLPAILKDRRILVVNQLSFCGKLNIDTKQVEFLWKTSERGKETVQDLLDPASMLLLIRRTNEEGQRYYLQNASESSNKQPVFELLRRRSLLDSATHQTIHYKRADGLVLAGNLYLPAGFDVNKQKRLPLLIWGYPRRYDAITDYQPQATVGVRTGVSINYWESPQVMVSQGYAFIDADMPLVPFGQQDADDSYITQLTMNARAVIEYLDSLSIIDTARVAIAGHSYGAAMVANLLGHTRLFKAGIAMSGGYNRTLTPFGFQDERRSYWQAPGTYIDMSALNAADNIEAPLLLIHGDRDELPGTAPQESAALFKAVQGNGGVVRYVSLPFEAHGYRARENILHWLWEMNRWLEKYVK